MNTHSVPGGIVHNIPSDLCKALSADTTAITAWKALTPLARNEWICWITSVKKDATRNEHLRRTIDGLKKGKKRPCCWIGCTHRTDKEISPSVKHILSNKKGITSSRD